MELTERLGMILKRVKKQNPEVLESFAESALKEVEAERRMWDEFYPYNRQLGPSENGDIQAIRIERVQKAATELRKAMGALKDDEVRRLCRVGQEYWGANLLPQDELPLIERMANEALEERAPSNRPIKFKERRLAEAVTRAWMTHDISSYGYKRSSENESIYRAVLEEIIGFDVNQSAAEGAAHNNLLAYTPPKNP